LGEVIIDEWKAAGLIKPSVIKPVIFTAEQRLIKKKLGQLKETDIQRLKQNLTVIIG
jgi:mRNA interferase MazF